MTIGKRTKAIREGIDREKSYPIIEAVKLVKDRATKEPATSECAHVLEDCREMGLLLGKGGLYGQTIRFSPPMCINRQDADFLLDVLDRVLSGI